MGKLAESVDSMLVISNDRLHKIYGDLPASQAFKKADNIVATAVKGVAEIITVHGNVNIDYTDVETVMQSSEVFIMGTGFATGEGRAMDAVNEALESPLLDSNDIFGTKNILLNIISGSEEIRIGEIGEIIEELQRKAGDDADIIWGNGYDERLGDRISVTILATGFATNPNKELQPKTEVQNFVLDDEPVVSKNEPTPFDDSFYEPKNDIVEETEVPDPEPQYETEPAVEETVMFTTRKEKTDKPKKKSFWGNKEKQTKEKPNKERTKTKKDEPVAESNIDNWFYKNFGSKIFNDDEDQPLED